MQTNFWLEEQSHFGQWVNESVTQWTSESVSQSIWYSVRRSVTLLVWMILFAAWKNSECRSFDFISFSSQLVHRTCNTRWCTHTAQAAQHRYINVQTRHMYVTRDRHTKKDIPPKLIWSWYMAYWYRLSNKQRTIFTVFVCLSVCGRAHPCTLAYMCTFQCLSLRMCCRLYTRMFAGMCVDTHEYLCVPEAWKSVHVHVWLYMFVPAAALVGVVLSDYVHMREPCPESEVCPGHPEAICKWVCLLVQ